MKKRIWIDKDRCISCGACVSMCPSESIFFDDDGKAEVDLKKVTEEDEMVIDVCPTDAILLKGYEDEELE